MLGTVQHGSDEAVEILFILTSGDENAIRVQCVESVLLLVRMSFSIE